MVSATIRSENGKQAWLILENDLLKVEIFLLKGAEVIGCTSKKTNVQVIRQIESRKGGYDKLIREPEHDYVDNFHNEYTSGAWFEMFPHAGVPTGVDLPFPVPQHGDLRHTPFTAEVLQQSDTRAVARVAMRSKLAPYQITRTYTVLAGDPRVIVREELTNTQAEPYPVIWGHHPTLGMPFIDEAQVEVSAQTILDEKNNRYDYPMVGTVDLRTTLGASPDKDVYRMYFLTDLKTGKFTLRNPSLKTTFSMEFDRKLFVEPAFRQREHRTSQVDQHPSYSVVRARKVPV